MRHAALTFVFGSIAAALFSFAGCSSSSGGGSTTSATGGNKTTSSSSGSTSSGSSSSTGSSSSSSGTGGQPQNPTWQCTAPPSPPASKGACVGFTPPDGGELDAGLDDNGNATTTTCNPVTNAGCTGNDVCTYDQSLTHYYCTPPGTPSAVTLCGDCTADTATCGPGMICIGVSATAAQCIQTCCTDADCGTGGKCDTMNALMTALPMNVGVCVTM